MYKSFILTDITDILILTRQFNNSITFSYNPLKIRQMWKYV